jgi:hypothetical protein
MSDKDLNTPRNREQLNTPRELTAKELDMVCGGGPTEVTKDDVQATRDAAKQGVQFARDRLKDIVQYS